MTNDIQITTHDELGNEHCGTRSNTSQGYAPYGIAGIIPPDAGYCICHECATHDELADEENGTIWGNDEWDYPGATCDRCNERLDTHLLVYQSQDPELHFRLRMMEEQNHDTVPEVEEIANRAAEDAYELGWWEGEPVKGSYGDGGEFEGEYPEYPADSAHYANNVAPTLRAIAGFEDSGHGTYQEAPLDVCHWILDEDVHPAFRRGYEDRLLGNEYGESLE